MNFSEIHAYCVSKPAVEETFPFDKSTLVFKVMGKMFALININDPVSINLKCDPERCIELREEYEGIKPGYHMSKTHWNTVSLISGIPRDLIHELIDHSYDLVVASLPKKVKNELQDR